LVAVYRPVFARPALQPFNKLLFRLALSGMGVLNYQNPRQTGEARFLREWLPRIAPEGGEVFDVGANRGDYTVAVHRIDPRLRVHAFEPHPATYQKLIANTRGTNVVPVNFGVGHESGELELYDRAGEDGSSHASMYLDVIEKIHGSEATSVRVPVITLDDYAARNGIERIALVKIDTEGNEYRVLLGMAGLLRSGAIRAIQFEFNEMNVASRAFMRDFVELLQGYDMYRLLPAGLLPIAPYRPIYSELFGFQNIVAIKRRADGGGWTS
jgi:FkbM family methyltransferase